MGKEMKNNIIGFDVREEGKAPPRGYREMMANITFDVNLYAGFTLKFRYVTDRHKVYTSNLMAYESMLSRDSVRIVLMLEYLNVLDVMFFDSQSAYLDKKP